jgi:hypothetical protein
MIFSRATQAACRSNPDDSEALKAIDILFETSMISSGFTVSTPFDLFPISYRFQWKKARVFYPDIPFAAQQQCCKGEHADVSHTRYYVAAW